MTTAYLDRALRAMRQGAPDEAAAAQIWRAAADWTLEHEGGFVDDPVDPGGATQWGISLRFLRGLGQAGDITGDGDVTAADIRALTRDQARELYRAHFWVPLRCGEMPEGVGAKVFDIAVNAGPRQAVLILQRGIRACGSTIADDGMLGPITWGALFVHPPPRLVSTICAEQAGFYRVLIAQAPVRRRFETGWLRRAYAHPPTA